MNQHQTTLTKLSRRAFLQETAGGLGMVALGSLLNAGKAAEQDRLPQWHGVVRPLHVRPTAKRIIWLFMAGGPSHLETFDYKPELARRSGQPVPDSLVTGQELTVAGQGVRGVPTLPPQHTFRKCGKSGVEITDIFPHLSTVADELCIIRSLKTETFVHGPASTFMNTGSTFPGRPAAGSWVTYGLGSESHDLPGFVVLSSTGGCGGVMQPISSRHWHSGFLPAQFQGIHLRSRGESVDYLTNPAGVDASQQRDVVDAVQSLNRLNPNVVDDPEIATRIAQYELAFRMQSSVPSLTDFSSEPQRILDMYGTRGPNGTFAANCLIARRLAERGTRFIQMYHREWDHHNDIRNGIRITASEVDQGIAALIRDLKERGMLDDTLLVWGGEFGRTPMGSGGGRGHHNKAMCMWLAGGGVKAGIAYGATDDFGYQAAEKIVTVHDVHATVLHLLGVDHTRLTYRFQGRDFRLTDVHGNVIHDILT